MALTTARLKIKTPSSLKEVSLYTAAGDMITPIIPFPVRVNNATLYAPLYPPKTIAGDNVYIYTGGKKYLLKENNTAPIPSAWTKTDVPFGLEGDIAAGNGMFMYVGNGEPLAASNEYKCYTSANGISWTQKTPPFSPSALLTTPRLAFHHNNFYCVANGGLVYSPDGSTWYNDFTPAGLRDGYVYDMWVNYWNQKIAYYIGEWNSDHNQLGLVGEYADLSQGVGRAIYQKGSAGIGASLQFWGKHFYISFLNSNQARVLLHLDSTPAGDYSGIRPSCTTLSISGDILPLGASLYIGDNITTDGQNFTAASRPASFQGMAEPVLVKGDDVSRRMGILSRLTSPNNYTWFAYDHMAGTSPAAILTTEGPIHNAVSANGIYLALQDRTFASGSTYYNQKLWTASFP
jgi:hypothetical protein